MNILRKSLKAYIFAFVLFVAMTFIIAALIKFTGFSEEWAYAGLVTALAAACLVIGYLEGRIIGKRGLITGVVAQAVFLLVVFLVLSLLFSDSFTVKNTGLFLPVHLLAGAIGGVIGANSKK